MPTMKVVKLRSKYQILAGSNEDGDANVQNYNWNNETPE